MECGRVPPVIDPRIVPNGRRDHFEQNVHFNNILTHLAPFAQEISRKCRTSSIQRKWARDFELRESERWNRELLFFDKAH